MRTVLLIMLGSVVSSLTICLPFAWFAISGEPWIAVIWFGVAMLITMTGMNYVAKWAAKAAIAAYRGRA